MDILFQSLIWTYNCRGIVEEVLPHFLTNFHRKKCLLTILAKQLKIENAISAISVMAASIKGSCCLQTSPHKKFNDLCITKISTSNCKQQMEKGNFILYFLVHIILVLAILVVWNDGVPTRIVRAQFVDLK